MNYKLTVTKSLNARCFYIQTSYRKKDGKISVQPHPSSGLKAGGPYNGNRFIEDRKLKLDTAASPNMDALAFSVIQSRQTVRASCLIDCSIV